MSGFWLCEQVPQSCFSGVFGWRRVNEQVCLLVGVLDSAAGDVEVAWFYLDPDEPAAEAGAGYASGAAAHEGVEDGLGVGDEA